MGESLVNFRKRRQNNWDNKYLTAKKIKPADYRELKNVWITFDKVAADIAYIRSRFLFHKPFNAVYSLYRKAIISFFSTGFQDESSDLYVNRDGHVVSHKHSRFRFFLKKRMISHKNNVQNSKNWFLLSLSIFVLSIITGFVVVKIYSKYGEVFLPPEIQKTLKGGELWTNMLTDHEVSGGASIILNNIMVALRAYGFGVFLGIPSLIILIFNGWHLGSIFAATDSYNMAPNLLQFVLSHGIMELTIIIFSCALGTQLGLSTLGMPKGGRLKYFTSTFWKDINSIVIASLWLMVCGVIESQISPHLAKQNEHWLFIPLALIIGVSVIAIYYLIHHGVRYDNRKS